ncbi:MAG TPA: sigma-54 dependent transcriptional regulator [Sedimentisphaerales bacterium]|nr:sigma-54 dependent transcriptional regulator [Sedimentisphaerales bacterium]
MSPGWRQVVGPGSEKYNKKSEKPFHARLDNTSPKQHLANNRISAQENNLIGKSDAFDSILQTIEAIAARKCPVIITGETGVGKEMVAKKIHLSSDRADKVFVPVDCTTLTGHLFESQLFGHLRGAFTGAVEQTLGFFRAADGGTLFLDEISEIPLNLQAKFLRTLQQNAVTPLGSTKSYPVDVRILCASNRDLGQMVKEQTFRSDLYYRLNVVNLEIPPLRKRKEDILPLAEYFLTNQALFYSEPPKFFNATAKKLLCSYNWPGNIRQLANAVERAYILTTAEEIRPAALPFEIIIADSHDYPQSELPTLDQVKRKLIIQALDHTKGHKIAAARILGIERRRLNRLMHKLNVSVSDTNKKTTP